MWQAVLTVLPLGASVEDAAPVFIGKCIHPTCRSALLQPYCHNVLIVFYLLLFTFNCQAFVAVSILQYLCSDTKHH
nr:MAG TPA_asm: hypothetical protein [Caudoviricetes sp.]